jgi:hypothetical protein
MLQKLFEVSTWGLIAYLSMCIVLMCSTQQYSVEAVCDTTHRSGMMSWHSKQFLTHFRCLSNTLFQFYILVIVIYFTNTPPPFLVRLLSFSNYFDSLTIPNWAYETEFSFIQKQLWNVSTKSGRLLIHLVTSRNVIEFYVHLHLIGTQLKVQVCTNIMLWQQAEPLCE